MKKLLVVGYGVVAYVAFFVTILYAIGFVGNILVPKSIDSGPESPLGKAVLIDVLLMLLFGVQHSIMARREFKVHWTKIVPKAIERSTFVLISSLLLALLFWQWRPIQATVWEFDNRVLHLGLDVLCFFGWGLVFYSSFLVDHFDLFGLRQVYLHWKGVPYTHPQLKTVSLYKYIRHPLMLGFLIAVWATPEMSAGHLLFSILLSGYIFVGTALEERDLKYFLGADYERYRVETPMLLPLRRRRKRADISPGHRPAS